MPSPCNLNHCILEISECPRSSSASMAILGQLRLYISLLTAATWRSPPNKLRTLENPGASRASSFRRVRNQLRLVMEIGGIELAVCLKLRKSAKNHVWYLCVIPNVQSFEICCETSPKTRCLNSSRSSGLISAPSRRLCRFMAPFFCFWSERLEIHRDGEWRVRQADLRIVQLRPWNCNLSAVLWGPV